MSDDVIQPTNNDRLLSALRTIIKYEIPTLVYAGHWEYAVEATDGTTVDCSPTDTNITLPSLSKVPILPSITGAISPPAIGAKCVICFLNRDPTKPRIISVDGSTEHTMTLEATVLLIYNVFQCLTNSSLSTGPAGPWTGATLEPYLVLAIAAALTAQQSPAPPGVIAQQLLNTTLLSTMTAGTAPSNGLGPLGAALAALLPKTPDLSGLFPGLGATK